MCLFFGYIFGSVPYLTFDGSTQEVVLTVLNSVKSAVRKIARDRLWLESSLHINHGRDPCGNEQSYEGQDAGTNEAYVLRSDVGSQCRAIGHVEMNSTILCKFYCD